MNNLINFKLFDFFKIFVFSSLVIISAGIALEIFKVTDSAGIRVSFFRFYAGGDYDFYKFWQSNGLKLLTQPTIFFIQGFDGLLQWLEQPFRAGPIFVWLLDATNYSPYNIVYFKIINLCLGSALISIWICVLRSWGLNFFFQILYFLCPLTLWIILIPGPDLILALCVFLIYQLVSQKVYDRKRLFVLSLVVILSLFTKPNALVLMLVFIFYSFLYVSHVKDVFFALFISLSVVLVTVYMTAYYLPYFIMYKEASQNLTYWNIPESVYLDHIKNYQSGYLNSLIWFLN